MMLPIKLDDIYIYDVNSIDVDLIRNENILKIGLVFSEEESDKILEKIAVVSMLMTTDSLSTFKVSPTNLFTKTPSYEDLMQISANSLASHNKLIRIHHKDLNALLKALRKENTFKFKDNLQLLLWELTNHLDVERSFKHIETIRKHLRRSND